MKTNSSEYQTENSDNLTKGLKKLRRKYAQNPIVAQISINCIRKKIEFLVPQIASYIDVLMTSETKIDESFKTLQFLISYKHTTCIPLAL